jgi:hypothetical protein
MSIKELPQRLRDAAKYLRGSWKSTHQATADLLDEAAEAIESKERELDLAWDRKKNWRNHE